MTLPSSITTILSWVFHQCSNLVSINIPSGVNYIGEYAFYGCKLENLIIPSGVASIRESTFQDCKSLKNLTILSCDTSIGRYAFRNCESLKSITIACDFDKGKFNDSGIVVSASNEDSYTVSVVVDQDTGETITVEGGEFVYDHTWGEVTYEWKQEGETWKCEAERKCSKNENHPTETETATGEKITKTTIEPTCTTAGSETYTATFENEEFNTEIVEGGRQKTVEISASHTLTHVDREAPTYEKAGHIEGYICSKCGKYFDVEQNEVSIEDWIIPKLYLLGDLNNDGEVNVLDMQLLFNIVAGKRDSSQQPG